MTSATLFDNVSYGAHDPLFYTGMAKRDTEADRPVLTQVSMRYSTKMCRMIFRPYKNIVFYLPKSET